MILLKCFTKIFQKFQKSFVNLFYRSIQILQINRFTYISISNIWWNLEYRQEIMILYDYFNNLAVK